MITDDFLCAEFSQMLGLKLRVVQLEAAQP